MGIAFGYCKEEPDTVDEVQEILEAKSMADLTDENSEKISKLIKGFEYEAVSKEDLAQRTGLVGIANMLNTCYISAAIQCLSHSMQLTEYILSNQWMSQINAINRIGSGGKFLLEYCKLIHELWKVNPEKYISPKDFRVEVEAKNDMVSSTH